MHAARSSKSVWSLLIAALLMVPILVHGERPKQAPRAAGTQPISRTAHLQGDGVDQTPKIVPPPAPDPAPPQLPGVSVLVHCAPGAAFGPIRAFAANEGGIVKYEYTILPNVINLRGMSQAALTRLAQMPGVVRIEEDRVFEAQMNDSTPLIRALQSQIVAAGFSADGSGVRVCVLDTGIDSDHGMYATRIDAAAGFDFVNNDSNPEDDSGHGAHVAGTAVGKTGLTVDFGCVGSEPFQGIAPLATLVGIKVLAANGFGSLSDIIAGLDYGADQTASGARCDVINMSLGGGAFTGGNRSQLRRPCGRFCACSPMNNT